MSFPKAVNILVAILSPGGPADHSLAFQITTCFAEALENGLMAVEGRRLDVTQALIKPAAPAVLNHCLA